MSTDILPVAGLVTHLTPPSGGRWLVADYEHLPDDGPCYELMHGELRMTPVPHIGHQTAVVRIVHYFFTSI
ncbi:MAG: hypothetical protein WCK70_07915 [Chloroflexales bacterium]|jgi:hypothetical protein